MSSAPIYGALRDYLKASPFEVIERPEENAIVFPVSGENGQWVVLVQANEQARQAVVYSIARVKVPPERRGEAAMVFARINWEQPFATFGLDLDDGEIRIRTAIDLGNETELTPDLITPLLVVSMATMDQHLPHLERLASSDRASG
jgi:hypothetical protein